VSATVTSASVASATVTSGSVTAATVETAAAGFAAMEATASSGKAAVGIATTPVTSASVGTVTIAPASPAAVAPAPTVPWAGTDKHSATKPLRTVVAVGCAGIWSISVVAVLTRRRPAHVGRPDSDGNSYLRLREGKRQHQDCQQR